MKAMLIGLVLVILVLLASGAMAYSGFNRYYYTDNYYPTVYYASPAAAYASTYAYPTYYNYGYVYPSRVTYYAPTYVYPTYTYAYPSYSGVSIYASNGSFGVSLSRGTVCGYYGYC